MNTVLKNLTVIPMTQEKKFFRSDIMIEDGIIRKIAPGLHGDIEKDCSGLTAIPGLINAHTHLSMTYMRNFLNLVTPV